MNLTKASRLAGGALRAIVRKPSRLVTWGRQAMSILRADGAEGLRRFLSSRSREGRLAYGEWIDRYDTLTDGDRARMSADIARLSEPPLISVLLPVYNTPETLLRQAIDSVRRQIYPHWELCIADDASTQPHVRRVLADYEELDERIRVVYRESNGHIAAASNSALELARGSFVALLDHDDELAEKALAVVALAIAEQPDVELIYSDEDGLDDDGERVNPHFKPDWSPDLLLSYNFVGHLMVIRAATVRAVGGFRSAFAGSQDYDLVLRVSEHAGPERIRHIPEVLYHWRSVEGSVKRSGSAKSYAHENARAAIREHLQRCGVAATVTQGYRDFHRVVYEIPEPRPLVSIIIGTRDRADLLRTTMRGVLERTNYAPIEVVIVDNQSTESETHRLFEELRRDPRVTIIPFDAPFNFSAINNAGVAASRGEIVLLLNNDVDVIEPGWLTELVSHACRPEVGAVGCKLYFGDGRIQHAGITLGIGGTAGHAFRKYPHDAPGYANRAMVIGNYSAVTGACLAVRRAVFDEVGGLDEEHLPIAFNDIDFCLRVGERGYRTVWTPHAELFHLESASRGSDVAPQRKERFERERALFAWRWQSVLERDPYYNLNLTIGREDFAIAFPRREMLH